MISRGGPGWWIFGWLVNLKKFHLKGQKNQLTFYIYHLEGGPPLGTISMDQAVSLEGHVDFQNNFFLDHFSPSYLSQKWSFLRLKILVMLILAILGGVDYLVTSKMYDNFYATSQRSLPHCVLCLFSSFWSSPIIST